MSEIGDRSVSCHYILDLKGPAKFLNSHKDENFFIKSINFTFSSQARLAAELQGWKRWSVSWFVLVQTEI